MLKSIYQHQSDVFKGGPGSGKRPGEGRSEDRARLENLKRNIYRPPTENYERITPNQMKEFIKQAKFVQVGASGQEDPESLSETISSTYSGRSSFAGLTDYQDHSKDTLAQLKSLALGELKDRHMQLGNYKNQDGTWVDKITLKGYRGGWSAEFVYKGKSGFGR